MQFVFAAIVGALYRAAGSIVTSALVSLGIGLVTYTGVDTSVTWLLAQFTDQVSLLPPWMIGVLAYMRVGSAINVVVSAMMARAVFNGLTSGTVKRWVTR